jgi:hypothetical protein
MIVDALEIHGASILLQGYGPKGFHFVKVLMKMDYLKSFTMGSIKIKFLILIAGLSFLF